MQFTVPQFIEYEPKIVGPLTFRQLIFIGGAGTICFILYVYLGKTNFPLFLFLATIIIGIGGALAFLKIGGKPLPFVLANFFKFSVSPKVYLWGKKESPIIVFKKTEAKKEKKEEKEEGIPLKIAEDSRLKKLKIQIETKTTP